MFEKIKTDRKIMFHSTSTKHIFFSPLSDRESCLLHINILFTFHLQTSSLMVVFFFKSNRPHFKSRLVTRSMKRTKKRKKNWQSLFFGLKKLLSMIQLEYIELFQDPFTACQLTFHMTRYILKKKKMGFFNKFGEQLSP